MIEQWELVQNLIDAKKALDSLWFISQHLQDLYNTRELCYDRRSKYYINTCAVLDKTVCKNRNNKKQLQQNDSIVMRLFVERDKHYAHKDKDYVPSFPYASIMAEAISLQQELQYIRKLCKDYLPDVVTLDFVCYDGGLFRRIKKINPEDEKRINQCKYPLYDQPVFGVPVFIRKALYDIDDLKGLTDEERKQYCVTVDNGLTLEEGLQNRQDACIKVNVLFNENMWASPNKESWDYVIQARKDGYFNEFGIIQRDKIWNDVNSGKLPVPSLKDVDNLISEMKKFGIKPHPRILSLRNELCGKTKGHNRKWRR